MRPNPLQQLHQTARARQNIYHAGEVSEDVRVICRGWAFRFARLGDGRWQILSFLLPGDIESSASIGRRRQPFSIQALTDVHYCKFNHLEFQARLTGATHVFNEFAKICADEKDHTDCAIVSLGRYPAEARIAGLIIGLMERLKARGIAHDLSFDFPLRQRHIADAVGLTTVHVSRVISQFHKAGIIQITQRQVRIIDLTELRLVANAR